MVSELFLFGLYVGSLFLQDIQTDSFGIPFTFSNDYFLIHFIDGYQVYFIGVSFLPIVGNNVIKSCFFVLLTKVSLQYMPWIGFVVGQDFLLYIFQVAKLNGATVFVYKPEPEVQEIVLDEISVVACSFST